MDRYKKIKSLLNYLGEFESAYPEGDMKEFSVWLKDEVHGHGGRKEQTAVDYTDKKTFNVTDRPEVELSSLLTNLSRFTRHYVKKALEDTGLRTVDEFGFLATLINEDSLLKSELINRHLMEISSGTEVLKRLIRSGFVAEASDPHDGRAKRVSLTNEGRAQIIRAFNEMQKVALIVNGNITSEEQKQVIMIFNKLKYFHWNIHHHDRETKLDELMVKYLGMN